MSDSKLRLGDILSPSSGKNIATDVVDQLSGRLVLTEPPDREDYDSCRIAISDIRHFLTAAATNASGVPELRQSILRMRDASMNFLRAAGQDSQDFYRDHEMFVGHLRLWRRVAAQELIWMCSEYGIDFPPDLQRMPSV